ncbi:hypothetical protein NG895_22540 [Aeoliella sp. ICT_H6.2]|uniref:Uncharacterized protein n=1 Tax=Aeoliella straminimaris TaxID=2954799 RepID=A0A9X2FHA4_9BACT|nr:hypothetical protein [Aeoliella straminimaris]MCO6046684.1 hypothetical protein [Aeoliella straminimaris]
MNEDSSNPYRAPTSTGQSEVFTFKTSALVACIVWALLSVAIWFGSTVLASLYRDFDVELPLITRVMLHPACPLLPATAALLLGFAAIYASPRQRYLMANWSFGLAFALTLLAVYALISPLVMLMKGLS